jgi:hypothetical protein
MGLPVESMAGPEFDATKILAGWNTVRERVTVRTAARGADTMSSISLTYRPAAAEPLYDGNNSQFDSSGLRVYEEREFCVFNKDFQDTYFFEVYKNLPFKPGRMRLMVISPLKIYKMHCDATMRAHIAIATNPDCYIAFRDGGSYHVPADGRLYVVDTLRLHTAYNAGDCERVHLVISVADTENQAESVSKDEED